MADLTPEGQRIVEETARRYSMSTDAVRAILETLVASGGGMAQFNHPDLGGMGQWSSGGMIMIGDMFNSGLKSRIGALCAELSDLIGRTDIISYRRRAVGGSRRAVPEAYRCPTAAFSCAAMIVAPATGGRLISAYLARQGHRTICATPAFPNADDWRSTWTGGFRSMTPAITRSPASRNNKPVISRLPLPASTGLSGWTASP
jgi:hypothetical protein